MKKLIATLIMLLLAWCIYSPVCLADQINPTGDPGNRLVGNNKSTTNPESTTSPESTTNPESTTSPESTTNPESTTSPESITNPKSTTSPKSTSDPESTIDPGSTTDPGSIIDPDGEITNIMISIPNSELRGKTSKVILIAKDSEWHYVKKGFFAINFAWVLLAFAAVVSIAVNWFLIFLGKGR